MRSQFFSALLLGALVVQGTQPSSTMSSPASQGACGALDTGTDLRFAVIGDYGQAGQDEGDVAARVASWHPDLVLTVGDNNYDEGAAETIDDNIGQYYHDFICPYAGTFGTGAEANRFLPALGNHDWATENAQPYLDFFTLPEGASGNERYYDYVQGPVHFYFLDSDPSEPDGIDASSVQADWLQAALAASTSAWDIVLFHHPPYSSGPHGSTAIMQWPFQQWGADAVIAGHDHTYERIHVNGLPYFVDGLGGKSRYDFATTPVPGSKVRFSADFGAMLVDATDTRVRFRFFTRTGALIDDYALTKPWIPLDPSGMQFQQIATGLISPVGIVNAGDGSGRLFIIQQGRSVGVVKQDGNIRIVKDGVLLPTPFLDLSTKLSVGGERGLLALAFHPEYATNGLFYVMYTNTSGNLTLSRFQVSSGNADVANPTETPLLTISHPGQSNHNGGTLIFGPDGYLYWSTGDGGAGGDPPENAQNLGSLLGKILRLDVDSASPYAVPASNPFSSDVNPNTQLIWAYGLRNTWRMAFDRGTGDLYIGDVGQGSKEEIDFQPADSAGGENYGWDQYEADGPYVNPDDPTPHDPNGKVFPVAWYSHSLGCSVTGGNVYRGADFPALLGRYFYGDYCSGRLFSMYEDPVTGWISGQLVDTSYSISTFGENENGELYLADYAGGAIYRIKYNAPHLFADVPVTGKEWMDPWIEAFYNAGITTGCGANPLIFCPENAVTRASMAVFLLRAEHGPTYVPPPATHTFSDMPVAGKEWMEPWVDQFYAEGITSGCGVSPLIYCPEEPVTRAAMAVFLLRALEGSSYVPPAATHAFSDLPVPGKEWMEPFVDEFYARGITTGCGANPLIYCPESSVTRAAMAVFIDRAYGLYP